MRKLKLTSTQKKKLTEALDNEQHARQLALQASQDLGAKETQRVAIVELICEAHKTPMPTEGKLKIEGDYLILPEAPGGLKKRVSRTVNQKANGTKSKVSGKK